MKSAVFGDGGVSEAQDTNSFDHLAKKADDLWQELCTEPANSNYFMNRMVPLLRTNMETKRAIPWVEELGDWTNNNCESINHKLKLSVDWKKQPLSNLVKALKKVIENQLNFSTQRIFSQ